VGRYRDRARSSGAPIPRAGRPRAGAEPIGLIIGDGVVEHGAVPRASSTGWRQGRDSRRGQHPRPQRRRAPRGGAMRRRDRRPLRRWRTLSPPVRVSSRTPHQPRACGTGSERGAAAHAGRTRRPADTSSGAGRAGRRGLARATCAADLRPRRGCRAGCVARRAGRPARLSRAGSSGHGMPACRECAGRGLAFSASSAAFCYEGPARALVTACKFRALRRSATSSPERAAPAFAAAAAGRRRTRRHSCRRTATTGSTRLRPRRVAGPPACGGRRTHLCSLLRRVRHGPPERARPATRAANVHQAFALRASGFGYVIDSSE
jgi:hypothetical protein